MILKARYTLAALLVGLVALTATGYSQVDLDVRQLEHEDYDHWSSIRGSQLSHNGHWIEYTVTKGSDESKLVFRHTSKATQYTIPFGRGSRFTNDSRFAVYRVAPAPALLKKLRKEKKPADQMPKEHLEILELETGKLIKIENVRSFQLPEENSQWLAVLLNEQQDDKRKGEKAEVNDVYEVTEEGLQRATKKRGASEGKKAPTPAAPTSQAKSEKQEATKKPEKKLEPKTKKAGYTLVLRNLGSGMERRFPNVTSYLFSKSGSLLAMSTSVESGAKIKFDPAGDGVSVLNLDSGNLTQILSGNGNYKNLEMDEAGKQVAFLTDRNDDGKQPSWSLYLWKIAEKEATRIAHEGDEGIPENWWVANSAGLQFSDDGNRLYFSTMPKPELSEDEDEEPKAKLDLWHWQDPQLQPQQLLQAARDRNRSYRAVFDIRTQKRIQLAEQDIPNVRIDPKQPSHFIVANTNQRYRKMMSWDTQSFQDIYLIDQRNGQKKLLLEKVRSPGSLSPMGRYVLLWDTNERQWMAMPINGKEPKVISDGIEFPLWNELHDTPSEPRPYGVAGWMENDSAVLVYDRFDIWKLDPTGQSKPVCLTNGEGRKNQYRFRYVQLDREQRHIPTREPIMLSAFDEQTKADGFFQLNPGETTDLQELIMLDEDLGGLAKAKEAETVMFTRSTFRMSPDIWTSDLTFQQLRRISKANPQQRDYAWGTAELTSWKSGSGEELQGIIYKPDGFDPQKKYPLLVYFYERNSDNLHRYYAPAAGRSIINFSFYVSRGYVLFVPDIPYRVGFPGDSAYDAVVPGVEHIVQQGYIDKTRIGMQGHSWGGYQTAYLVTKTDMFACAESGAPVSNMTSAYGGIRWGSGMSRMFQYEKTQSRIGATLWEDREKYILNSPVFQADKINTPLLILHNDQDGAVPWYQGIELFVALRRLEKPAWLMNYNGEPHWVMKDENRIDFAKRMQQFFDHYLKGDPMPVWMAEGIPAVDKGKKFGFEPAPEKPKSPSENEK